MKRKSLALRLALILGMVWTAVGVPTSALADSTTAVVVSPADATATTCAEKTIAIQVENVTHLTAYHLEFSFDPTVIEVTSVVNGGFLTDAGDALYEPTNKIDNTAGTVSFGMAQKNNLLTPMTPESGSGDLVTINVQALVPNDSSAIAIDEAASMLVDWPNAFPIGFTATKGTVNTESCPPIAMELSKATVLENEPIGTMVGLLATTDPDVVDTFTYSLEDVGNFPDNAGFSISGNQLLTAVSFDFESQASHEIKIRTTDSGGQYFEAIFTVDVGDVNEAPTANADTYSTLKNQPKIVAAPGVLANDEDPEGDTLQAEKLTDPPAVEGTVLLGLDGMLVYTPPAGWIGSTSFTYRAFDGEFYSEATTVTIQVNESNQAPTGITLDDNLIAENAGVNAQVGTLSTVDPDPFDSFTYSLVPGEGADDNDKFTIVGDQLLALESFDFEVKNAYTIRVRSTDQGMESVEAILPIFVVDVNDQPVADGQAVSTNQNVPVTITLTGSDQDGDSIAFVLLIAPTHGTLNWTSPGVTYTPDEDYFGPDSFQFKAIDEHNFSSEAATVTIDVVNTTIPKLEGVTPAEGHIVLGPSENFILTVDAKDDNLYELEIDHSMESNPGTPEFSVYADETDPYGGDGALFDAAGVSVTYDATLQKWTIDFGATITDTFVTNGGITFYLVLKDAEGNQWGTMYGTTPENTFVYTLERDDQAPVLEEVTPAEGHVVLGPMENFILTVDALDDNLYELEIDHSLEGALPEFSVYASQTDPYGGDEDDFDTAGVSVTYDITDQVWTIDFGTTITDAFVANGGITFYLVLTDTVGNQWGTMYGTTPENTFVYTVERDFEDAPSDINLSNNTVEENAGLNAPVGALTTVDADPGDTFTYSLVSGDGDDDNGLFNIFGDQLRASDSLNFEDQETYTIRVRSTDPSGLYFEKIFIITVTDVNDAPIADDQELFTIEEEAVSFVLTGSDEDDDPLTFDYGSPSNGVLSGVAPNLTYTPGAGFTGTDSFTFRVFDGTVYSTSATITITTDAKDTEYKYFLPLFVR